MMMQEIPRNDLQTIGITQENYQSGTLEDWTLGSLSFNGVDQYCRLPDSELKRSYHWEFSIQWVPPTVPINFEYLPNESSKSLHDL